MKKYSLVFVIFMLYSCTCKQVNLTKNEKQWLDPYKKGDLLIFKSNKGKIDSIIVSEKKSFIQMKIVNGSQLEIHKIRV